MPKRCFLFVCLNGRVSFWEYAEGIPLPCSIHGETSFPKDNFWEVWKKQYRLEDDEPRDFLFVSDHRLSKHDVPKWFGSCGVDVACWTHDRLGDVISRIEDCIYRDVVVELGSRRSTVWHGGNAASALVLHGISTSELCLPEDRIEEVGASKMATRAFLSGAEERHSQNERRCRRRR